MAIPKLSGRKIAPKIGAHESDRVLRPCLLAIRVKVVRGD